MPLSTLAWAQPTFYNLAPNADGSQLWFSSRRTTEIVPATPTLRVPYPYEGPTNIVAGSVYTLTMAEGLPPISSLRLSGVEQHILSAGSDHIAFQAVANEDTSAGWLELVFAEQSDSPFVSSALWGHPTEPTLYAPFWYRRPDRSIVAMHQDYRSEITFENPARPAEIVHLYGSGFGPVTPPVDTGQPAPASPLSTVAEPFACQVWEDSPQPVELLFAGLAPGWIGLYQFDVRLPDQISAEFGYINLGCGRPADLPVGPRASGPLPTQPSPATE